VTEPTILKVAVNVPLSRLFDYLPPAGMVSVAPGGRVRVPFGRRQQVGLVIAAGAASEVAPQKLKRCVESLDDEPLLTAADLQLIRFTSSYYHHPIGEVAAAALPSLLRAGKALWQTVGFVAATAAGGGVDLGALGKRAPRQAELLQHLLDAGGEGVAEEALTDVLPNWRRAAKGLFEKGWAERYTAKSPAEYLDIEPVAEPGPRLNTDQLNAVATIRAQAGFGAFLLDGITGSGKTEVYLSLIREVLDGGRQVLTLVPEIGLTPQLVSRLRQRLGVEPAVLHSGLGDAQRLLAWRQAQQGQARLVVGTRSAVFTPLPQLGMIVVDEEHDPSLKQQEGLRYSARDLAIVRARNASVPVILGSATPTLETLQHCVSGNFTRIALPSRAGGAAPPTMRLVDLGRATSSDGLSEPLAAAMQKHLQAGGQVLLFLNRRGFAPTLICAHCGHIAECARCDSRMTVHARDSVLRCHHCGSQSPLPSACSECGSEVRPLGAGTERLEDSVKTRFPGVSVQRIDSDSTQKRGSIEAALSRAEQGSANILVGTQMLSKGHHFPQLTLVGVINADQGLFGTDFRSAERLAQSIIQVAGRAGRESRPGEVLIQTAFPEHPFWQSLIDGGYPRVAAESLAERQESRWPPFTRLALLRAAAHRQDDAMRFLQRAAEQLAQQPSEYLRVLGPVHAPMAKKAGRYRAQLLLQSSDRKTLHARLAALRQTLEMEPAARKVRWSIDVDPIELF
jgi:primosomal protein N' (replication factor Y)